jgi:hypothetical protein
VLDEIAGEQLIDEVDAAGVPEPIAVTADGGVVLFQ